VRYPGYFCSGSGRGRASNRRPCADRNRGWACRGRLATRNAAEIEALFKCRDRIPVLAPVRLRCSCKSCAVRQAFVRASFAHFHLHRAPSFELGGPMADQPAGEMPAGESLIARAAEPEFGPWPDLVLLLWRRPDVSALGPGNGRRWELVLTQRRGSNCLAVASSRVHFLVSNEGARDRWPGTRDHFARSKSPAHARGRARARTRADFGHLRWP